MVRDGLFKDVHAALAWHPAPIAATGAIWTAANNGIRITFRGRTAHAGNSPWDGRSAVDAAELLPMPSTRCASTCCRLLEFTISMRRRGLRQM